eukprot:IDg14069t1
MVLVGTDGSNQCAAGGTSQLRMRSGHADGARREATGRGSGAEAAARHERRRGTRHWNRGGEAERYDMSASARRHRVPALPGMCAARAPMEARARCCRCGATRASQRVGASQRAACYVAERVRARMMVAASDHANQFRARPALPAVLCTRAPVHACRRAPPVAPGTEISNTFY